MFDCTRAGHLHPGGSVDYETYRKSYFVDPTPEPRFRYVRSWGAAIYVRDFARALEFYTRVFGPPGYVEGHGTRGWMLGEMSFTLLAGGTGGPTNVELILMLETPGEADRLHAEFLEAGGQGEAPSDQLMYEPLRYAPVTDPFGTTWLLVAKLT
ncbi:MAG: hypothetical protein KC729_07305 [Candidatus Eisenbacteria bacterium]|uniref:Glyoxalase/fosfomycin resistance/dioxygenase domain-containing protein n=1 Tax=Eiseniibacteriota bacterium TaxID=2212470 RepID=A0A956LYC2_UNCEI|nr:hypothetical protein [Candidatus Eisenbacteria bacterium]